MSIYYLIFLVLSLLFILGIIFAGNFVAKYYQKDEILSRDD